MSNDNNGVSPSTYFADVDGYDVGDRLLEGVMFRVDLAEHGNSFKVTSVKPRADARDYLANIRWEKFAGQIQASAEAALAHLTAYAADENTTVKALFDEFAADTGLNGGNLLNET